MDNVKFCGEPGLNPNTSGRDTSGNNGITSVELKHMMELRNNDAIINLQNLGGITKLCHMLNTSPTNGSISVLVLFFIKFSIIIIVAVSLPC